MGISETAQIFDGLAVCVWSASSEFDHNSDMPVLLVKKAT